MTNPSGLVVTYTYDDLGRVQQIHTVTDGASELLVSDISYLPFGPVSGYTLGNGIERNVSFNQDYRLTAINDVGEQSVLSLDYEYDDNGNIIDLNNVINTANTQGFDYDELDRLIQAEGGYGAINYDYDPVGNRLSKTHINDTDTQDDIYNYFLDSNQLSSIDQTLNGEASVRSFELDENGNTIEDASTQTITYTYNAANRPITATGGASNGAYTYNALGQRVSKVISFEGTSTLLTTTYTYDEAGQLISETTRFTSGTIDVQSDQRDYVYLHNQLVAVIVTTADTSSESGVAVNIYYVHNDHLNTPQILTDGTQQAIWEVTSQTPFGELEINEDHRW